MKNNKGRIATLSSEIIAIISTITAIEIPIPTSIEGAELLGLSKNIGIFLVSFLIIINSWNNQRKLLNQLEDVPEKFIWRIIFWLAFLSLLPIFSAWMMTANTYRMSVFATVGYGIVNLLIQFAFSSAVLVVISKDPEISNHVSITKLYKKMSALTILAISLNILLAVFYPKVAMFLFLAIPVLSSITNVWKNEQRGAPSEINSVSFKMPNDIDSNQHTKK